MLVGVAALSAWGLYRFNQILASLPPSSGTSLLEKVTGEALRYKTAFAMQYGGMFFVTMIVCIAGALLGLLIAGKHTHADEDGPAVAPVRDDEPATQVLSVPADSRDSATQRIPRSGGHRADPDATTRIPRRPAE
jgi:hypothetical protein